MVAVTAAVNWLNGIVWGVPMLILILGVGLYLTVGLKLMTIMKTPFGFSLLWQGRIPGGEGDTVPGCPLPGIRIGGAAPGWGGFQPSSGLAGSSSLPPRIQ